MRCSYILVCFGCQIVPAWYLDYVFAPSHRRTNNPLPFICLPTSSVCLLYLSASELPPLVQKQLSWPSFSSSGNCIPLTLTPLTPSQASALQTLDFVQPKCQINSVSVPFFPPQSLFVFVFSPAHLLRHCILVFVSHFCFFGGVLCVCSTGAPPCLEVLSPLSCDVTAHLHLSD